MVSVVDAVGFAIIVGVHTLIAAVATRYFRITLKTTWGSVLYSLLLIPVALVLSTLVLSGVLGLGSDVGGVGNALLVTVLVPITLGFALDFFWMPDPEDVDLPDTKSGS